MNDVSVKERLKNLRKETGKTFDELLILYGMERLLYRISMSKYNRYFVLKGGALLYTLLENKARMTRDIDMLAKDLHNEKENVQAVMIDICSIDLDDALTFDWNSIQVGDIAEDDDYHGVRFVIIAYLGKAKIHLQIDIGFSDIIYPEPQITEFPSLLKMEKPKLLAYPIETVIAEKYEAMTSLGDRNSRYKDFYDIVMLSRTNTFTGRILQKALKSTFERRGTAFSQYIYSETYIAGKERLWQGFKRRTNSDLDLSFAEAVKTIGGFILPVQEAIENDVTFSKQWNKREWSSSKDNGTIVEITS